MSPVFAGLFFVFKSGNQHANHADQINYND